MCMYVYVHVYVTCTQNRLAYKPTVVEFVAGEAGMSAQFANLGWSNIINEVKKELVGWGPMLRETEATFWEGKFLELGWNMLMKAQVRPTVSLSIPILGGTHNALHTGWSYAQIDFAWFGLVCTTWCGLGNRWGHRDARGNAKTPEAHEADKDATRAAEFIVAKSFMGKPYKIFPQIYIHVHIRIHIQTHTHTYTYSYT